MILSAPAVARTLRPLTRLLRPRRAPVSQPTLATDPGPLSPLAGLDAEIAELQAGLSRAADDAALAALIARALQDARAERLALIEQGAQPLAASHPTDPFLQLVEDFR